MEQVLKLIGVGASPYTRKVRAALRYRRIPYRFVIVGSEEEKVLPKRPLPLVPGLVVYGQEGEEALSDSTPMLSRLEDDYAGRSLRPANKALRLIDSLIEDYGDEWLAKCMFHYRWSHVADTKKASGYLPYATMMSMSPLEGRQMAKLFADRQISRIGVVGSNSTTATIIEASWKRFLKLFDAHMQTQPYFLGSRPGAGDFACYGQMTMLVITDPTPMSIATEISPRAYAWTERLEDLSGIEVDEQDWLDLHSISSTLTALLAEIGRVHVPFLMANASAVEEGAEKVECTIDGQTWIQEPFVYQAKCLRWLRQEYAALDAVSKTEVDRVLAGTGCEVLFG